LNYNGRDYQPFQSAFNNSDYSSSIIGRRGASPIPHRCDKTATLDAVMDLIKDGDAISYPHYYRMGDKGLQIILKKLKEYKKKGIILYASAIFDNTDPWLAEAFADGTLAGLYGNVYRKIGARVMRGDFLPWQTVGLSHGNRVRKLQTGEVHVKIAFGPVPIADIYGNANGLMGKEDQLCGPLGLFAADSIFADYTCLLAGTISQQLILPAPISMENIDFVVPLDPPGLLSGIGSGTLDLKKIRSRNFNQIIAHGVTRVMQAARVMKDNFNFQIGSGAGLIVLDYIRQMLKQQKTRANFAMGGCTTMHVEMLEEGSIKMLMHGQLFEASTRVIQSLLTHPLHHEITSGYYASVANKESAVNMLDLAVLSALEVDREFNINTVCANGKIVGGIGGSQDVAAGADLTILFLPLATGKDGNGFPRVVDKVYVKTVPGEVIDVVVTEEYVALNPNSKSSYREAIKDNAHREGVNLISMDELQDKALAKANEIGPRPKPVELTDEVVHIIEWRDGTLLDTIKKPFHN